MPIYEYHCQRCSKDVELLVRSSNDKPECPNCGSQELAKQWSVPAAARNSGGELPISQGGCGAAACQRGCQFE